MGRRRVRGKGRRRQQAVDALAKCLGPVAGMFGTTVKLDFETYNTLPLREDVKQLPLCVFKRLLKSEGLQLQWENETCPLLLAWLHQSPRPTHRIRIQMSWPRSCATTT